MRKEFKNDDFKRYTNYKKSERVYNDPSKINSLLNKLTKVFHLIKNSNLLSEGKILYSLLKDYKNGSYREISKKSMLIIIGGLLYLVNPADVIPDFVPLIGFLDDATLIGLIFKQLNEELTKYKSFKVKKEGFDDNLDDIIID